MECPEAIPFLISDNSEAGDGLQTRGFLSPIRNWQSYATDYKIKREKADILGHVFKIGFLYQHMVDFLSGKEGIGFRLLQTTVHTNIR